MTRMESRHFDHCRRIQLAICKKSLFDLRLPLGACLGINELQLRHLRFPFNVYLIQCQACRYLRVETAIAGHPPHRSGRDQFSSRLGTPNAAGRGLYSLLPPGFPVVPQYLGHTSVAPQSLSEPDKRLSQHPAPRFAIQ